MADDNPTGNHPESGKGNPDKTVQENRTALQTAIEGSLTQALRSAGITVPPGRLERVSREAIQVVTQSVMTSHRGPMPPPDLMQGYEQVVPGLAKQIADMAFSEQRHRHRWENFALWNDSAAQLGGLFLGGIIAIGCAAGAFYLALHGNNIGAGILLSVVVVSVVRTIVTAWKRPEAGAAAEEKPSSGSRQPKKGRR